MIRYVIELLNSMSRHLGEAALAIIIATAVGAVYLETGLDFPVVQFVLAIFVFQFSVASWRLYRTQQVSIATTRSLRNLDDLDRVKSELRIRAQYEHRERRLEQWHTAQVKRLIDDVADVSRELTRLHDRVR